MFDLTSKVVDLIDHGISALKDLGCVEADYVCKGALKLKQAILNNQPNLTMQQYCQLARNRDRMVWASLSFNYVLFPELRQLADRDLKRAILYAAAYRLPLASRILGYFGDKLPDGAIRDKVIEMAKPNIVSKIQNNLEYESLRGEVNWQ